MKARERRKGSAVELPKEILVNEVRPGLSSEVRADLAWAGAVVLSAAAIFALLQLIQGVAAPVLLSLGLAYALDPLVDRFEARGFSRSAAILLLGAVLLLVLGVAAAVLVPQLVRQVARIPEYLQAAAPRVIPLAEGILGRDLPSSLEDWMAQLGGTASSIASQIGPALGGLALRAVGGTASAASTVLGFALVPVFLFFFLRDFDRMKAALAQLLPPRHRQRISGRFGEIDEVLSAFVRGQVTVAAILGAVYAIGLTLAGVKLGLAIGLIAGVASLVPVAGVAVGGALAAVAVLVDWHTGSSWIAAGAGATFVVGQVLEGYVVTPRVVGEKVGLSAAVVMLAILVFGELFGLLGMFLAVPLAAVGKVVARVLIGHYRASAWYRKRA